MPRAAAGGPGTSLAQEQAWQGEDRTAVVSIPSRLVSPQSVLAVLSGLLLCRSLSHLPVLYLAGASLVSCPCLCDPSCSTMALPAARRLLPMALCSLVPTLFALADERRSCVIKYP